MNMKLITSHLANIRTLTQTLILACLLGACNYLDVIPPAQADFDDTVKDGDAVLNFLYSCYAGVLQADPFSYAAFETSTDENINPSSWGRSGQVVSWRRLSPTFTTSHWGESYIWNPTYDYLGQINMFTQLLDAHPDIPGLSPEDRQRYKGEICFLKGYYHFRVLEAFGPVPIIDSRMDQNITNDKIPGRSHFDYCVDYIVGKLDEAAQLLPPTIPDNEKGRATSVICKSLKARLLLYAASPLWNGGFPYKEWKNKNYETPGYGKELVSHTYDPAKWQRALTACQEALDAALAAGHKLYDVEDANMLAANESVDLPIVPGRDEDTPENETFKEKVRMLQYLSIANESQGNRELIWGLRVRLDGMNMGGEGVTAKMPSFIVRRNDQNITSGWAGMAPTLYTATHFYTSNGILPSDDKDFFPENEWYTRFDENCSDPGRRDVIKLHAGREPRFYAWMTFDGDVYSRKLANNGPLYIDFKDSETNGWNEANERNYVGTGYLSKKFIDPNMVCTVYGNNTCDVARRPFIRLAELYLNLAECHAALGHTQPALDNLNFIRRRAGIPELTEEIINGSSMDLTEWIRNERFIELFEEGHRYYDIRRWMTAPELLKAGAHMGLNGHQKDPSFETFNRPVQIDQPFKWDDRMYLLPIWSNSSFDELYSNPQMVQAPGY